MMLLLRGFVSGVTAESIRKRIAWLALSFLLLYVTIAVLSCYPPPQGCLRGKHRIFAQLRFSPVVWVSTLQIFGYNLIPTTLIMLASLIAQQSRLVQERYVPVGYTAFWGLTVLLAMMAGSCSFEVAAAPPALLRRLTRLFDVVHHAGLVEFSAYLLAADASFQFTLFCSDGRRTTTIGSRRDFELSGSENASLLLALLLLLCAAYVESLALGRAANYPDWSDSPLWT
ncbi:MAG: hypothetical protein PVH41_12560 [Anaerolineae bacterium]|jgi:hypothetical protein